MALKTQGDNVGPRLWGQEVAAVAAPTSIPSLGRGGSWNLSTILPPLFPPAPLPIAESKARGFFTHVNPHVLHLSKYRITS